MCDPRELSEQELEELINSLGEDNGEWDSEVQGGEEL